MYRCFRIIVFCKFHFVFSTIRVSDACYARDQTFIIYVLCDSWINVKNFGKGGLRNRKHYLCTYLYAYSTLVGCFMQWRLVTNTKILTILFVKLKGPGQSDSRTIWSCVLKRKMYENCLHLLQFLNDMLLYSAPCRYFILLFINWLASIIITVKAIPITGEHTIH